MPVESGIRVKKKLKHGAQMEKIPTMVSAGLGWITVVAGALRRADGRLLMHQRPVGKHHAGLWEFPGGKVEAHEIPCESLSRELQEELGIACDPDGCTPLGFAETGAAGATGAIVILLYAVSRWRGEPQSLERGAVGWFTRDCQDFRVYANGNNRTGAAGWPTHAASRRARRHHP